MSEELFDGQSMSRLATPENAQFLFDTVVSMMFALALDGALAAPQLGATDREGCAPRLPPKIQNCARSLWVIRTMW